MTEGVLDVLGKHDTVFLPLEYCPFITFIKFAKNVLYQILI